jgi:outer membrane protein assembly factor BamD (BamD/ComL family)
LRPNLPVFISAILFLTSCASVSHVAQESAAPVLQVKREVQAPLEKPQSLFQQGKFSEAIAQFRKLTKSNDRSVAETAQYRLAYTFAYYKNGGRDYREALNEFQLFLKKFPESGLKEEAANWIFLLNQTVANRSENDQLRESMKRLVDIDIEAEQKQRPLR